MKDNPRCPKCGTVMVYDEIDDVWYCSNNECVVNYFEDDENEE